MPLKKVKFLKRLILWAFVLPLLTFGMVLWVAYAKQDRIVQSQIAEINKNYAGQISVGDSHLAPFENFPDVSIKIDNVAVYESKEPTAAAILEVADIYVGFNFWDIVVGNYDIHSLLIEDGMFDIVLHTDGTTNLENAIATSDANENGDPLNIHLRNIELKNIDLHKRYESTKMDVETLIYWAKGGFKSGDDKIQAHVDSEFELNVINDKDTTYFKHKHFEFHTDFEFDENSGLLVIEPSGINMEHGEFEIEGSVATRDDMTLDLEVTGTKPSFDMFIAFAPEELIPVLEQYKNQGDIYLNASIKGPTSKGRQPAIDASFGASKAYLENPESHKRIDQLGFLGHFTNGDERNLRSMEFSLTDFSANLNKGDFIGELIVKNFEEPEIDMQLNADFNIPFLVSFLNLEEIQNVKGSVAMELKFHDIVDLNNPEKVLSDLNQAYYAELKIEDLSFDSSDMLAPLKDLDLHLEMNGKQAQLDQMDLVLGNSHLSVTGSLSDLPAIIHHANIPVTANLEIRADTLDIAQLTRFDKANKTGINEQIKNLSLSLSFKALGNAFTEFEFLPKGAFYINDFHADLKNYPHQVHDFHTDIIIEDENLNIKDFTGFVDASDFHINGTVYDYGSWMQEELEGKVKFDLTVNSDLLQFESLFTYDGENYVPEDYRHEEINDLQLHFTSDLNYQNNTLGSINVDLDKFEGKMKVHPLRFEDFKGKFQYEDDHVKVDGLKGKMGRSRFEIATNYYLGEDETIKKRDNAFSIKSDFLDFDALSNYNEQPQKSADTVVPLKDKTADAPEHAEAFNIYELPFTDMQFNVDIGHFVYHRLDLKKLKGQLRTTQDHYIHLDTLSMDAAGGYIAMNGFFDGSDAKHIYLEPNLNLTNVDLDKLLFKFENFGQDVILSENLHGKLNSDITGKILVYPDMTVDLDQSEVHIDAQVLKGRLENYDPVLMLSDYYGDKDLTKVRFDTLQNHMDIVNGKLSIPNMTIESTLGHIEISGTQNMNDEIDYYIRIPWRVLLKATRNKIFGAKKNDPDTEDEIIQKDEDKRTRYVNLNITGTLDDYKIKMGRDK
ncbi:MAG: AsmA-like C-terminal region-containing protein [Nonlabens sp.]